MIDFGPANAMDDVWQYGLFEALYGRRSRRFGLGFEITEGPLQYNSPGRPLPLTDLERARLAAPGDGTTGTPPGDLGRRAGAGPRDGAPTAAPTAGARRRAWCFT